MANAHPFGIGESPIHGKGVFATRPIGRGDLVGIAILRDRDGLRQTVLSRYLNHSGKPNATMAPILGGFALWTMRDVGKGEELVVDYGTTGRIVLAESDAFPPYEDFDPEIAHADPRLRVLGRLRGLSVMEVDGPAVRRLLDADFANSGRHSRFPFIPRDELWIGHEAHPEHIQFPSRYHGALEKGTKTVTMRIGNEQGKYRKGMVLDAGSYNGDDWGFKVEVLEVVTKPLSEMPAKVRDLSNMRDAPGNAKIDILRIRRIDAETVPRRVYRWIVDNVVEPKHHCFFYAAALAALFPGFTLMRGWNTGQFRDGELIEEGDTGHFWVADEDGYAIDPTAAQYPGGRNFGGVPVSLERNLGEIVRDPLFESLSLGDQAKILMLRSSGNLPPRRAAIGDSTYWTIAKDLVEHGYSDAGRQAFGWRNDPSGKGGGRMLPKPPPTIRHWLDSRLPRGNVVQEIEGEEGTFRVVPRKLEAQEPVDGRWMHVVNVEIPNLKAFLPRFMGLRGEVCFSSVVGAHTAFMGGGDFLAVVVDGPAQATFAKDVWSDFDPWTGRRFLTGRRPVPLAAPTGVQEAWVIPSETRLVGVLTNSQDYAKEAEEMDVSVFGSGSFGWWEPAEVPEPREWERAGRHPLGEGWEGMPPPKRAAIPAIRLPFYKISKDHKYIDKKKEDSGNFTYIYDKRHVAARNRKKEKRLQKLNRSLKEMRAKVKGDLSSDNETRRLAALAVALIDETYERIGNEESASELKHYGVTGWLAKHVSFGKGRATIRYVGKAGVKQSKEVKDKAALRALRRACEGKRGKDRVLEGISPKDVNAYLAPFGVTTKDIRGFHANKEMLRALGKGGKPPKGDGKAIKERFKKALEDAAKRVGHDPGTLRRQYLIPRIEQYHMEGKSLRDILASVCIPPLSKRAYDVDYWIKWARKTIELGEKLSHSELEAEGMADMRAMLDDAERQGSAAKPEMVHSLFRWIAKTIGSRAIASMRARADSIESEKGDSKALDDARKTIGTLEETLLEGIDPARIQFWMMALHEVALQLHGIEHEEERERALQEYFRQKDLAKRKKEMKLVPMPEGAKPSEEGAERPKAELRLVKSSGRSPLSRRAASRRLYHYAPVRARADIAEHGLKTPHALAGHDEELLERYRERTAETLGKVKGKVTAKDVLRGLERRRETMFDGEGGSRALSAFLEPIPDTRGMHGELREFRASHDLYSIDYRSALRDGIVEKAAVVEEKPRSERPVEPKDLLRELEGSRITDSQWRRKGKFHFSGKTHAMVVLRNGVLPPEYLRLEKEGLPLSGRSAASDTPRRVLAVPPLSKRAEHVYESESGREHNVDWLIGAAGDLPTRRMPIPDLEHLLDEPHWGEYSPRDVLRNPGKYPEEMADIAASDTRYPILLDEGGNLVDGAHRLAKAVMAGMGTLPVRIVPQAMMEEARLRMEHPRIPLSRRAASRPGDPHGASQVLRDLALERGMPEDIADPLLAYHWLASHAPRDRAVARNLLLEFLEGQSKLSVGTLFPSPKGTWTRRPLGMDGIVYSRQIQAEPGRDETFVRTRVGATLDKGLFLILFGGNPMGVLPYDTLVGQGYVFHRLTEMGSSPADDKVVAEFRKDIQGPVPNLVDAWHDEVEFLDSLDLPARVARMAKRRHSASATRIIPFSKAAEEEEEAKRHKAVFEGPMAKMDLKERAEFLKGFLPDGGPPLSRRAAALMDIPPRMVEDSVAWVRRAYASMCLLLHRPIPPAQQVEQELEALKELGREANADAQMLGRIRREQVPELEGRLRSRWDGKQVWLRLTGNNGFAQGLFFQSGMLGPGKWSFVIARQLHRKSPPRTGARRKGSLHAALAALDDSIDSMTSHHALPTEKDVRRHEELEMALRREAGSMSEFPVEAWSAGTVEQERELPIDLSGWRYEPLVTSGLPWDRYVVRVTATTSPGQAAQYRRGVSPRGGGRGRPPTITVFTGGPYPPDAGNFHRILEEFGTNVRHEMVHLSQDVLRSALRLKMEAGLPPMAVRERRYDPSGFSRSISRRRLRRLRRESPESTWSYHGGPQLKHPLRDIEFQSNLRDSIKAWRRQAERMTPSERRDFLRFWVKGDSGGYHEAQREKGRSVSFSYSGVFRILHDEARHSRAKRDRWIAAVRIMSREVADMLGSPKMAAAMPVSKRASDQFLLFVGGFPIAWFPSREEAEAERAKLVDAFPNRDNIVWDLARMESRSQFALVSMFDPTATMPGFDAMVELLRTDPRHAAFLRRYAESVVSVHRSPDPIDSDRVPPGRMAADLYELAGDLPSPDMPGFDWDGLAKASDEMNGLIEDLAGRMAKASAEPPFSKRAAAFEPLGSQDVEELARRTAQMAIEGWADNIALTVREQGTEAKPDSFGATALMEDGPTVLRIADEISWDMTQTRLNHKAVLRQLLLDLLERIGGRSFKAPYGFAVGLREALRLHEARHGYSKLNRQLQRANAPDWHAHVTTFGQRVLGQLAEEGQDQEAVLFARMPHSAHGIQDMMEDYEPSGLGEAFQRYERLAEAAKHDDEAHEAWRRALDEIRDKARKLVPGMLREQYRSAASLPPLSKLAIGWLDLDHLLREEAARPLSKRAKEATPEEEELTYLYQLAAEALKEVGGYEALEYDWQRAMFDDLADALWHKDLSHAKRIIDRILKHITGSDKPPLSKRAAIRHLHHYAPPEARADILENGLKTPYALLRKDQLALLDRYRERTADNLGKPKEKITIGDMLKGLELRRKTMFDGSGGSRALSVFLDPIPDIEGMHKELRGFVDEHDLYRINYAAALKDGVVEKAAIVEEKPRSERPIEPKDLMRELDGSPITSAQWRAKGKFYFSGKAHAMIVLKDGLMPAKYLELVRQAQSDHPPLSRRAAAVPSLEGVPLREIFPPPRLWRWDRSVRGAAAAHSFHIGHSGAYWTPFIHGDIRAWIRPPKDPHGFGFLTMYLSCGSPTTILPRDRMLEAGYEVSIQPHYSRRPIDVAYYRREIEAKSLEEMADLWFGEKAFIDSLNLVGLWRRIAAKEGQSE